MTNQGWLMLKLQLDKLLETFFVCPVTVLNQEWSTEFLTRLGRPLPVRASSKSIWREMRSSFLKRQLEQNVGAPKVMELMKDPAFIPS